MTNGSTGILGDRQSTTTAVKNRILSWIEEGRYKPGDVLPSERDLQAEFRVSRVSVREAMVGLHAIGLVEIQHGRGCYVSARMTDLVRRPLAVWLEVNRDEVIGLLKVRAALDGLAAHEAAERGDVCLLSRVGDAHRAFCAAVAAGEATSLPSLDNALHLSIAQASGIQVVENLLSELDGNVANSHRITMAVEGRPERSAAEHSKILDALLAGDGKRARREAEDHVMGTISVIQAHVDLAAVHST